MEIQRDDNIAVMRHQQVTVNVWQMILTSCMYLFLAFCAWVLLRLVNACFWLPSALKKQQAAEEKQQMEQLRQQLLSEGEVLADVQQAGQGTDTEPAVEETKKTL